MTLRMHSQKEPHPPPSSISTSPTAQQFTCVREHVKSSTSPKKRNYCQRGEGGSEAIVNFLTSQPNGDLPFRGGGGSGDKQQEFPFFGDVEILT